MGKTIALKLSDKEEQIVTHLNKRGISNSELLRNALRQYFESVHQFSSKTTLVNHNLHKDENIKSEIFESLKSLKQEIQELKEQMIDTQKKVQSDIMKLQRQLYLISITEPHSKQSSAPINLDIDYEIHQQVDEFLKKQIL